MPSQLHGDLVALGARWLRKSGFSVVATELAALGCREQADVIGFRSSCSAIVEVKVSRGDFLADARKPERRAAGTGHGLYRFYLSPPEVIAPADLPSRWGLLHVVDGKVKMIVGPVGNIWPGWGNTHGDWSGFQHDAAADRERSVLFSIARRLAAGQSI